jgi:hypothetical protein
MKITWQRQDVLQLTGRVEEIAALVAGARLAVTAMEAHGEERAASLRRVLDDVDRAILHLPSPPPPRPRRSGHGADQVQPAAGSTS